MQFYLQNTMCVTEIIYNSGLTHGTCLYTSCLCCAFWNPIKARWNCSQSRFREKRKKRKYANRYTVSCEGKKEKKIAKNLHKFLIIHRKYVCKLGNQLALHFEIQFFSAFLNFHMEISERKYDKLSNSNA